MASDDANPEDWSACPDGTLAALNRRLAWGRQRRVLLRGGVGAAVLASIGIGAVAWKSRRSPVDRPVLAINCQQCRQLRDHYRARLLTGEQVAQVEQHLGLCPHCQNYYEHAQATG